MRWLRDPDHDRLRWAIALSRAHYGGSDADDERLAAAILSRLEQFAATESEPDPEGVLDDALIAAWHDSEIHSGIAYPVLFYDVRNRGRSAVTEPCIYCGRRHSHGNLEGDRVPHCGEHTHDLTPSGRHRNPYAAGFSRCNVWHRNYILRPRPLVAASDR